MNRTFRVAGVSGSLRRDSLNSLFLRTMAMICPDAIRFDIYPLHAIPLFNVDSEAEPGEEVLRWREALAGADLLLLVSPEYAHGVTGVMKNALDWIVSSGELTDKPLAFPNLSVRANLAQSQLAETLQLMGCRLLTTCSPSATLAAPYVQPGATEQDLISHPEIGPRLHALWRNIVAGLNAPA